MDRAANQPTSENVPNVAESIKTGMRSDHYVGERAGIEQSQRSAQSRRKHELQLHSTGMKLWVRSLQSFENP